MIVLGLTGSIAMGKSTTARLFAEQGAPVFDSDGAVAELYEAGGAAVGPIQALFPHVIADGAVDREKLAAHLRAHPADFAVVESVVHPLVAQCRTRFIKARRAAGAALVVLDTPLLFEAGLEDEVDIVVVVSAPESVQRARALARPGMTPARLDTILARQSPDSVKRARADFVIDTGQGIPATRDQVRAILQRLTGDGALGQTRAPGARNE